jgi:hypothetical protein
MAADFKGGTKMGLQRFYTELDAAQHFVSTHKRCLGIFGAEKSNFLSIKFERRMTA